MFPQFVHLMPDQTILTGIALLLRYQHGDAHYLLRSESKYRMFNGFDVT